MGAVIRRAMLYSTTLMDDSIKEDFKMMTGFAQALEKKTKAKATAETENRIYNNIVARLKEQHPDWSEQQIKAEATSLIGVL